MVIDTSAIVAVALNEPEAEAFKQRIADAPVRLISAATVLEAALLIETRLKRGGRKRTRPVAHESRRGDCRR